MGKIMKLLLTVALICSIAMGSMRLEDDYTYVDEKSRQLRSRGGGGGGGSSGRSYSSSSRRRSYSGGGYSSSYSGGSYSSTYTSDSTYEGSDVGDSGLLGITIVFGIICCFCTV